MSQQDEEYLSVKEACERLGVSRRTLERYVKQGRINRYQQKITRRVFFKPSEVEELFQKRLERSLDESKVKHDDTD